MASASMKSNFHPLNAYISGYAFENATTALGALEEGRKTQKRISAEMLCTLDNFLKVIFFSERIFVYGVADEKDGQIILRDADLSASPTTKRLFDRGGMFHPLREIQADPKGVFERVKRVLAPVDTQSPWFVVNCRYAEKPLLNIHQEMVSTDAYLLEYLIDHAGFQQFKPVFPGEHLYLGLRQSRYEAQGPTRTVADLAGRRLRGFVRDKIRSMNENVAQMGYPPLPTSPPIFVASLLHECPERSELVSTLLEIRNSPALNRFRQWATQCEELAASEEMGKRARASQAVDKVLKFSPESDMSDKDFGKGILKIIKGATTGDVLGIVGEVLDPLLTYWGGLPLSGLRSFGGKKVDPEHIRVFLQSNFHDTFNRTDMEHISLLLWLPDNLTDWKALPAKFDVTDQRRYPDAPNLARPVSFITDDPVFTSKAVQDFEILLGKAVPFQEALKDEVEKTLRALASGQILLVAPEEMRVGVPIEVEASARRTLAQDLTAGMKERGLPEFSEVRVEEILNISLRGDAFTVEPQSLASPSGDGIRWSWRVTAQRSGTQTVQLMAKVKIQIPMNAESLREYVVNEKSIQVKGGLGSIIQGFLRRITGGSS